MRLALVAVAVLAFASLGLLDVFTGRVPVGIASILLAVANGILLR